MAVAAPSAWASAVKSRPAARRVDGQPPGIQSAGEELVRHGQFAARGAGAVLPRTGISHSPVTQPRVAGTSTVRPAVRAAPISTSGFWPSESTRKNFRIAADSPSSTITELLDCSPERTFTTPVARGRT